MHADDKSAHAGSRLPTAESWNQSVEEQQARAALFKEEEWRHMQIRERHVE
jgi:hypothetical protein